MQVGNVVDGRFELEARAGMGGMGEVYRARDRQTGKTVALKLLHRTTDHELRRFAREAQTLAVLRIPGVVRYVAHGLAGAQQPYLAMEWLDGVTLTQRLAQATLTVAESIALGSRVAATLAAVHALGFVHRDLKPSNLLLVGGSIDQVVLIDFGIVRLSEHEQQLTMPGAVIGTPGYMAPEQARGQPRIDARADIFALGCVLYQCVTGRAPFEGRGLALLAKVLLDEPPRVTELRADVPLGLDALIARMLSKSPDARPKDGASALTELEAIALGVEGAPNTGSTQGTRPGITAGERRIVCLIMANITPVTDDVTRSEEAISQADRRLTELARDFEADLELLDGRSPLLILSGASVATDLAARAARCALELATLMGGAPVVLVTGRAELPTARLPMGELINRATALVTSMPEGRPVAGVRIDELTAGLLGSRFEVADDDKGAWLQQVRDEDPTAPRLLGKHAPFVGRARELSLLTAELRHCLQETIATGVLLTGPPGLGKSRLCSEFLRTLDALDRPVNLWYGKGDPMSAGSAFALLAQAVRRAFGIRDDEPIEVCREKILARTERHRDHGIDPRRTAGLLGEMLGARFPDEDDDHLRAARRNPMLMSDQIREAWKDFISAECSREPVILVLDDLHWADLPTVTLIDAALGHLKNQPFFVLALSRPEVRERFPKLWETRNVQLVHLTPLTRRASERLVREAISEPLDPALVAQIVERADGNALFLEEQIRAVANGKKDTMPETVLAMVEGRLEALDGDARRVLRAASVFGETFCQSGVAALLGGVDVAPCLRELTGRELILERRDGRLASEVEYRFRHALIREAAYSMLTERDLRLAHALAGEWLDESRDADPCQLAEHFERGGVPLRAAKAYLRAAEQALRGNDLASAVERAERGIACAPDPETVGALRRVQAEAHMWLGEYALAEERGLMAMARLVRGSSAWFFAAVQVLNAMFKQGAVSRLEACLGDVVEAGAAPDAETARHICLGECATTLIMCGMYSRADSLIETLDRALEAPRAREADVVARLEQARAVRITPAVDPEACLAAMRAANVAFEQAGDHRNACNAQMNLGSFCADLGDFESAEAALRAALARAERMGLREIVSWCLTNLGPVLAQMGKLEEGRRAEESALAEAQQMGNVRLEGAVRVYLAKIALLAGDGETALREASLAAEILRAAPPLRAFAIALRARALLDLGRHGDALDAAREASHSLESLGAIDEGESLLRLVHAEALAACGFASEARAAIAAARDTLQQRADKLHDPAHRERYLRGIREHARTLELARAWAA